MHCRSRERQNTLSERLGDPRQKPASAALDLARTTCRRAERRVAAATDTNPEILRYLNRLSDLCWILARYAEKNLPAQERS